MKREKTIILDAETKRQLNEFGAEKNLDSEYVIGIIERGPDATEGEVNYSLKYLLYFNCWMANKETRQFNRETKWLCYIAIFVSLVTIGITILKAVSK